MYDIGRVLSYGPGHREDRYGGLGEANLYDSGDDWSRFAITKPSSGGRGSRTAGDTSADVTGRAEGQQLPAGVGHIP